MALRLINASSVKPGNAIIVEENACIVKSNDISKTGKHGHAKCRIEAINVIDGKKKVFVTGGHERLEVPLIKKNRGQILSVTGDKASIMDLESFETIELPIPEDLEGQLKESDQIEYWDVEGKNIIKRKF
jgi:translation initiation factor 5A